MCIRSRILPLSLLLALLLLVPATAGRAAPDGDDGKEAKPLPAVVPGGDEEKPLAPKAGGERAGKLPGDRKVYVPFKNLKDVFEKEGQGVFVPYEEFLKLWEANLDRRPVPEKPPVDHLVTRARYEGSVEGDLAVVKAEIEFETFREGWSSVPLGLSGVALGEATVGGEPATIQAGEKGVNVLVSEKGSYTLELTFVASVVKAEDLRTVAFRIPSTPVSRLVFDVPEEEARVTVEPNLATTRTEPGSGTTRVMAYVGAAESLSLSWRPRPAEVKTGPALQFADSAVIASVEEAALRTRVQVDWRIYRAPVAEFKLTVPEGNRVLFVEGEDIRLWDVEDGVLTIGLNRPVEKAWSVAVTLERDRPGNGTVPVPAVRVLDVAREQGYVTVRSRDAVRLVPSAEGLYRTDFASVPNALRADDLLLAWRYPAHPWSLDLIVERVTPEVEVEGRTRIAIDERNLAGRDVYTWHVTRAPVFEARLALPPGISITEVSRDVVDDFRVEGEEENRVLVLDLKGSRIGDFSVTVDWRMPLALGDEPLALPLPLTTPAGADRVRGIVGIARDESLKLTTGETRGLVAVNAAQFGEGTAVAFRYTTADRAAPATLSRRDPEVTARVDTALRAEENRIAVRARITWTIRYAGVEEFSFLLPASLEGKFEVTGNNLREKPVADAGEGRIRQRLVLQGKVTGSYAAVVEYDLPYEGLAIGESKSIEVPSIEPEDVKRDEGTFAVYREPMLEITADVERLEPIDPRELPTGIERKDVFHAFKYLVRPHRLELTVVKHEFLPVLTAVVHHMQLVTVLNEEGAARTEVILKMTNNGLQFLTLRPESPPDTLEIVTRDARGKFHRRKEVPQAGEDGAILVRMPPEAGPDDVFFVRAVYPTRRELPGTVFHDFEFRAPEIQGGAVPVLGTTWFLYPPVDQQITQAGGTLRWYDAPDSWLTAVFRSVSEILPARGGGTGAGPRAVGPIAPDEIAELAPRGQSRLEFGGRVAHPTVEVTFASPGGFTALRVLVFLLTLAGSFLAFGRLGGRAGGVTLFACVAAALLFAPIAAPGMADMLSALLLGAVVGGAAWAGRGIEQTIAARRRLAAEAAVSADAEEE